MSRSRTQLEDWLKTLDCKAKRVLDVGGSQLPVSKRTKLVDGAEVKILDLENPHEGSPSPDIVMDIKEHYAFEEFSEYHNYFSAAFCLEVMEYVYDPVRALKNISYFLQKGAKLYISFHFLYPTHKPSGKDYLRYTEYGAMKLLENAGFDVHRVDMRFMSVAGADLYNQLNATEGNKQDPEYSRHYVSGYLITAVKK